VVVGNIFGDLHLTRKLPEDKRNLNHLLMAMHTLGAFFDINQNDAAKIERIQALKEEKLVWPTKKNGSNKEDDNEI
jgi:hypothetical protein